MQRTATVLSVLAICATLGACVARPVEDPDLDQRADQVTSGSEAMFVECATKKAKAIDDKISDANTIADHIVATECPFGYMDKPTMKKLAVGVVLRLRAAGG